VTRDGSGCTDWVCPNDITNAFENAVMAWAKQGLDCGQESSTGVQGSGIIKGRGQSPS